MLKEQKTLNICCKKRGTFTNGNTFSLNSSNNERLAFILENKGFGGFAGIVWNTAVSIKS
jgi:hypothetical protein